MVAALFGARRSSDVGGVAIQLPPSQAATSAPRISRPRCRTSEATRTRCRGWRHQVLHRLRPSPQRAGRRERQHQHRRFASEARYPAVRRPKAAEKDSCAPDDGTGRDRPVPQATSATVAADAGASVAQVSLTWCAHQP